MYTRVEWGIGEMSERNLKMILVVEKKLAARILEE